jgi:hypothetical protein
MLGGLQLGWQLEQARYGSNRRGYSSNRRGYSLSRRGHELEPARPLGQDLQLEQARLDGRADGRRVAAPLLLAAAKPAMAFTIARGREW